MKGWLAFVFVVVAYNDRRRSVCAHLQVGMGKDIQTDWHSPSSEEIFVYGDFSGGWIHLQVRKDLVSSIVLPLEIERRQDCYLLPMKSHRLLQRKSRYPIATPAFRCMLLRPRAAALSELHILASAGR